MGRQVNFYFVEEDEQSFLQILEHEEVIFLRDDDHEWPSHRFYGEFRLQPRDGAAHSQTLMCRKCDLKHLRFSRIATTERYYIDSICSYVIEFTRSGYREVSNTLVSGRIWYEHTFWDKDSEGRDILVAKDEELKKLYERLARWIKKYCKRLPNGNYIAPHATELYAKGAELSP